MSTTTALVLFGLLIALLGVGGIVTARLRPGSPTADRGDEQLAMATDLAEVMQAFRSIDRRVMVGVAVAVVGLLLAGVGAYLGSDAHALRADVGGGGTNDDARVGGSW